MPNDEERKYSTDVSTHVERIKIAFVPETFGYNPPDRSDRISARNVQTSTEDLTAGR